MTQHLLLFDKWGVSISRLHINKKIFHGKIICFPEADVLQ